ncbi:uncharacterized protein [Parasteatoda tepidariorum]|uniref:uncharacterized protein isoform X2 n=1 Tax=Parasteatoda tepidariorum TaxID=114398 RepID=UPI001C718406|nr:uncharacterized protein LOC107457278 isoform X2 [Parasteatoda tepidariorum]
MVHTCCAYGCSERFKKGSGLGFFRFPLQKSRRIQWTLAVRRKDFIPNRSTRICGKHFITGKPSKDIKHPDYVPTIFTCHKVTQKRRFPLKKLCEFEELPVISTNLENNSFDELSESDNDECVSDCDSEVINNGQIRYPEFKPDVENSPLINAETIKRILGSDAAKDPSLASVSNTPELCCKNKAKKTCMVDISDTICLYPGEVKSEINSESETTSIKSEPVSDLEIEPTEEEFVNYFSELKDFEQLDNCFGIKIQDVAMLT